MSNRNRLILVLVAAAIVLAAVIGLIIAGVNSASGPAQPEPEPSTGTSAPSEEPTEPVDEELTVQGWLEEPETRDFKAYGEIAARAPWFYDSRETSSAQTIEHYADWVGETPPNMGSASTRPLALRRLALLVPNADAFDEQRQLDMWVTSRTIGETKVDLDHRDFEDESAVYQALADTGLHTVTSTVEITYHFTGTNGVEQTETDEQLQTVTIYCPASERCRVVEWNSEPIF